MALYKSQVLSQASGSVGGLTYSHARGGMYMRARAVPVNPQTPRQTAARNALAMYSLMWSATLTQAQRDAWDQFAANVAVTNALGDTIYLSGQNHFIRANQPRRQAVEAGIAAAGLATIDAAPAQNLLPPVPTIDLQGVSPGDYQIAWQTGEMDPDSPADAILIYVSPGQNQARRGYKGPWRLDAVIQGNGTTAPTSPFTGTWAGSGYTQNAGQRVFFRARLTRGNAAENLTGLGPPAYFSGIVI